MSSLSAFEIRQKFLDFFAEKEHKIVSSAPIVLKNDPTLLFTNAGMNQFKDYFLGNEEAAHPRIANTQKCLRVSGKHNDLEEVGVDTYHHTMFEMLGNWSFGDYFKKEAIAWAWELLTEVYKIDAKNLYITVFEGDEKDGLGRDDEAIEIWKKFVDEKRILLCNKKDNFWEMGDTGPCGPCSEIHIDLRSDAEKEAVSGKDLVNKDHPQVIEIWNLVFIQFNRSANGSLQALPNKHVDTGMGLERLTMALQGKKSNYDSDIFMPIIESIERLSRRKYTFSSSKEDVSFRVISDHVRTLIFTIADGQLPSNNGAGYVTRRILRRAIRYGFSFLEMKSPFIYQLFDDVSAVFNGFFPEIDAQRDLIVKVILEEEKSFLRTLDKGISRIDEFVSKNEQLVMPGKVAFELYDTYGFPVDLTALILEEYGRKIDISEFDKELQTQKNRSRNASTQSFDDWQVIHEIEKSDFIGYDQLESEVKIARTRRVTIKNKEQLQLVLDKTPFYAESGGQVGDIGIIFSKNERIEVLNTVKENNLIIHIVDALPTDFDVAFTAKVDKESRLNTARNHSATHILHYVLRKHLGKHVQQKGSLVNSDYLRFDFSHFEKIESADLRKIEVEANEFVRKNMALNEFRSIPIAEAQNMNAMALFGEKYGDEVRVIKFGDSVELCGGTHVKGSGEIGLIKILSEGSVAAGIRRIEAISGPRAFDYLHNLEHKIKQIEEKLKFPKDILKSIDNLLLNQTELTKELQVLKDEKTQAFKNNLSHEVEILPNGLKMIVNRNQLDAGSLKDLSFYFKETCDACVFISDANQKVSLHIALSEHAINSYNLQAPAMIKKVASLIQGGGGGQAFYASAGGKDVSNIAEVLHLLKQEIIEA